MSEEANTRLGEAKESAASGLLLSVESIQGGDSSSERLEAMSADTHKDKQDSGDALVDVDGTDESDGTDDGSDTDGTDTLGDTDGTDSAGDDGTDAKDSDGTDS
jgi:hypothetical protein